MKATAKKSKLIAEEDIDGPMMSGKGMSKEEMIQIAQWVKDQKTMNNTKSSRNVSK